MADICGLGIAHCEQRKPCPCATHRILFIALVVLDMTDWSPTLRRREARSTSHRVVCRTLCPRHLRATYSSWPAPHFHLRSVSWMSTFRLRVPVSLLLLPTCHARLRSHHPATGSIKAHHSLLAGGVHGSSYDPAAQSGPWCSGECPQGARWCIKAWRTCYHSSYLSYSIFASDLNAGYMCPGATELPLRCRRGSWCTPGSAVGTPCVAGRWSNATGLSSAMQCMQCTPCRIQPETRSHAYPQPRPPPLSEPSARSPILGEAGFYCSAAAAYACPKATWSNKTNQQDASTCLACPSPGRMTTHSEGTSSIDGCVCQERYYTAAAGGCELCPVGATAPTAGSTLASVIISVGESALILREHTHRIRSSCPVPCCDRS